MLSSGSLPGSLVLGFALGFWGLQSSESYFVSGSRVSLAASSWKSDLLTTGLIGRLLATWGLYDISEVPRKEPQSSLGGMPKPATPLCRLTWMQTCKLVQASLVPNRRLPASKPHFGTNTI